MTISLLLTLCAALQTPAPAPAQAPQPAPDARRVDEPGDEGWSSLNRVVIVVNDDIVTYAQLQGRYAFALRSGLEKPRTRAEQEEFVNALAYEAVRTRLKAQAGEALGFDPAQVERIQRSDLERAIKARGGVVGFSEFLASRAVTAEDYRQVRRDFIYTELWEDAITGSGASVSARPSSDRYARPGLLRFEYANAKFDPAFLADIGGRAETVHFRWLLILETDMLPLAQAQELTQRLRGQIVDGADMEGLIATYSAAQGKDSDITTDLASAMRFVPQAASFLSSARSGDVSDVVPFRGKGVRGYTIYRLEDRTPGEVPALEEFAVQQKLTRRLQTEFDQQRIETALQRARASSYVWRYGEGDVSAADPNTPLKGAAPTDRAAPASDTKSAPPPPADSPPPDAATPPHDPKR
jgi:hypothetical protein